MKLFEASFLKGLGYTGSRNDMNMALFKEETGVSRLSINDMAFQYFGLFSNKDTLEGRYNDWKQGAAVAAPTQAEILAYTGNFGSVSKTATKWSNVPYNRDLSGNVKSWSEVTVGGTILYCVMDVYIPLGTAPPGGWPVMLYFHSNGSTNSMAGSPIDKIRDPLLAAGYAVASIEFPHPVTNKVALGANWFDAYYDCARAVQYVRSYSTAMGLNPNKLGAVSRSRGSLCVYASLLPERANPLLPKHWERQSSYIPSIYMVQGQTLHNSRRACEEFVFPVDWPIVLAERPADDATLNAADLVGIATQIPRLHMTNDTAYYADKVDAATILADFVHYPNMMKLMKANMDLRDVTKATTAIPVANGSEFDTLVQFADDNVGRYGPNLAIDPEFDSTAGWSLTQPPGNSATISGGVLTIVSNDGLWTAASRVLPIENGKNYIVGMTVTATSGSGIRTDLSSIVGTNRTAPGSYVQAFLNTVSGQTFSASRGAGICSGSATSYFVKEILP